MDKMDIKNFFRFFAPALITIGLCLFFVYYQDTAVFLLIIRKIKKLDLGGGVVFLIAVSTFGHLLSTLHHATINHFGKRIHHIDFVKLLNQKSIVKGVKVDSPQNAENQLQSVSTTDALFYYLVPDLRGEKENVPDKKRIESLFDFLHGLGALLTGWILVSIVYLVWLGFHASSYKYVDPEKLCYLFIVLLVFISLILGWLYLRKICKLYPEFVIGGLLSLREKRKIIDFEGGEVEHEL